MSEELSPEIKLYVKEVTEDTKKSLKEDIEKAKSITTRILSTVVVVVGLLTTTGVWQLWEAKTKKLLEIETQAEEQLQKIEIMKGKAEAFIDKMKADIGIESTPSGYAQYGDILFVWGNEKSTSNNWQNFSFHEQFRFLDKCFVVVTGMAGLTKCDEKGFSVNRVNDYGEAKPDFGYLAIGK